MSLETPRQSDKVRIQQYQTLLEISEAIASNRDLASLFRNLAQRLREVVEFNWVSTLLYDPARDVMRIHMLEPPQPEGLIGPAEMPVDEVPSGWAWKAQEPLIIKDAARETRFPQFNKWARQNGVGSYCALPLTSAGRRLGALGFASVKNVVWNDDDLGFLTQVARQVAVAIDNAINFESVRSAERRAARERDRIKLLLEINNAIVSHLELGALVKTISASLLGVLPHEAAGISLYEPEENLLREYENVAYKGFAAFQKGMAIPLEGTPAGLVFTSRQPLLLKRPDPERFPVDLGQRSTDGSRKSACLAPLISHGRKLGILGVGSAQEDRFTEEDLELLTQVADQVAIAVENSVNFGRAREAERELARKLDQLRLMLRITNAVVSQLDLRELLDVISASIREAMGCDTVGVGLYNHESKQLIAFSTQLPPGHPFREKGVEIPLEGATGGLAFTSGQPVFLDKPDPERFNSYFARRIYEDGYRSGGSIPLIAQGRKLGVLGVASKRQNAFSDDDKGFLVQVANQVAIAVDNALNFERTLKAEEEAKRQSERLSLMLEINNAVVSKLDLRELLKVISACLRRVIPHDATLLTLHDPESARLRLQALDMQVFGKVPFEEGVLISMEDTPEGEAITSRRPVLVGPGVDLTRFSSPWVRHAVDNGVRSGCAVPLISHDRTLGALSVVSLREDAFNEADAELLTQFASQIAIAIENALNFERARVAEEQAKRQYDQLRLMLEINNAVVSRLDLRELIHVTASCLREVLHHDIAGLSLYDPDTNQLRAYAYDFPDKQFTIPEGMPFPLEGTLGGMAFTSGQSVFINRPGSEEIDPDFKKRFSGIGVRSGGCVPLIVHGRKLGVLGVGSLREDAFPEDQQELLTQIASQIAIGVDNALNFERARKAEQEVRRQFERERLMLETNNVVVTQLDLRELVRAVSSCLREVLQPDVTGISLYDPETNQFRAYFFDLPDNLPPIEEGTPMPLEGTVGGLAFVSGRPVFMSRPDPAISTNEFDRRLIEAGIRSGGVVPLIAHDRKLGFLGVGSFREDAFSEADQELLCHIANQIAIAVENALNFERARAAEQEANRHSDRLQLLLKVNNAIASALDLPALFPAVSASLRQVFRHDFAVMGIYDEQMGELRAYAMDGGDGLSFLEEGMLVPLDGTPPGLAITTKQVVIIGPGDAEKFSSELIRRAVEQGLRSSCTAPLLRHNRAIGAMSIVSKTEAAFNQADGELLMQIAGQVAIAVENALAYREIDALKNKLASEKLYLEDEIRTEHNFEEMIGE